MSKLFATQILTVNIDITSNTVSGGIRAFLYDDNNTQVTSVDSVGFSVSINASENEVNQSIIDSAIQQAFINAGISLTKHDVFNYVVFGR